MRKTIFIVEGKFDKKFIECICTQYKIIPKNKKLSFRGDFDFNEILVCNGKSLIRSIVAVKSIQNFIRELKVIQKQNTNCKISFTKQLLYKYEFIVILDKDLVMNLESDMENLLENEKSLINVIIWDPNIESKLKIEDKKSFWKNYIKFNETQREIIEDVFNMTLEEKNNYLLF